MNDIFFSRLDKIEKVLDCAISIKDKTECKNNFELELDDISKSYISNLVEPCKNLMKLGGKRWRPLLLVLCAENAREVFADKAILLEDETYSLTPIVEFVHTASLIHDDIEDSSDMRRGKPSAHILFGLDVALNAASWLYFEATSCIDNANIDDSIKAKLYKIYANELKCLHLGQAIDIFWHRNKSVFPTIEEYFAMVKNKTGTLASLSAKIGTIIGGGSDEDAMKAGKIASEIGKAFQILDDVQNLTTGNPGKKRGDDIVEGKKSLPVLMHIKKYPNDKEQIETFFTTAQNEGVNSIAVEKCISLLSKSGAITEAFEFGKNLVIEKSRELSDMYPNANANLISELFTSMITK